VIWNISTYCGATRHLKWDLRAPFFLLSGSIRASLGSMNSAIEKLILASPRGFCAGVDRAVETVKQCLDVFGAPIYVKHAIVHNVTVVAELEEKGAITVETVDEVPEGGIVVFSAHGSKPEEYEQARNRRLTVIDATCPLVTKVHLEVHRFAKEEYQIVYIGHKGHVEGEGVRAEGKKYDMDIPLVESIEEAKSVPDLGKKIVYLTQTTLSVSETADIIEALKERFPHIQAPPREDICYATTNRQQAVRDIAEMCDVVLVVGSKTSSNSNRLCEVVTNAGARAHLIDRASDIDEKWFEERDRVVGLSAGASAPEHVVQEVMGYFGERGATTEERESLKEDMRFALPLELQKKMEKVRRDGELNCP